ncbi:high frequency lysogenization protein HflD [Endozoicomonas sp. 8E]|uniref:high frequency lysogenization protein HflD n=1 Tax=Endozoicomonas sp. 8E TaxID=3035692 RepID=UPI0029394252|nr:high frequency lysogenization protein HflD [Endozoicomonas sp. 8E]WOG25412.1 high frequency lysogenization protein HflD [Endozoicomonas sp. 8E]
MQYTAKEQAAALSAIFQAAGLVERLAKSGQISEEPLEPLIGSLFVISPDRVEDVFNGYDSLLTGRKILNDVLQRQADAIQADTVRYALTLIHLERKLSRNRNMLGEISQRLQRCREQAEHFGILHENVIASLAGIYLDTISTFKTRVQVSGDLQHLQNQGNADKIRAILFAGIRAAILWRQTGGSRWQLLLSRKKLLNGLNQL